MKTFSPRSTNHLRNLVLGATLPLLLVGVSAAQAGPASRCDNSLLRGVYVFTATGFTRAPGSLPGTPWVPKAILEVLEFHGDGTVDTPQLTAANLFGDTGTILQPPTGGAPGVYTVNDDCTGTLQFADAANVAFSIRVEPPQGDTIQMIQTNPPNNVFQGTAKRSW